MIPMTDPYFLALVGLNLFVLAVFVVCEVKVAVRRMRRQRPEPCSREWTDTLLEAAEDTSAMDRLHVGGTAGDRLPGAAASCRAPGGGRAAAGVF